MASKGSGSHAEIWDDSALVDSWNDALGEYKKYHSLTARGEDVNKVLKKAENATLSRGEQMDYQETEVNQPPVNEPDAKKDLPEETVDHGTNSVNEHVGVTQNRLLVPEQASNRSPALPQPLIGKVHDEGLKNLLMSWYYAGYYTGLHEGRQEGKTSTNVNHEA